MRSAWLVLAAAAAAAACSVAEIDLAGRDCPCVAGYRCDATTNKCVAVPGGGTDAGGLDGEGPDSTSDGAMSDANVVPYDGPLGGPDGGCSGCQALETDLGAVYAMGIDPSYLYWATAGKGSFTLSQAPLGGGAPKVMAMGLPPVSQIAANVANIYLLANMNEILAFSSNGMGPITVWNDVNAVTASIAVDSSRVYWGDNYACSAGDITSGAPGQNPTTLASAAFVPGAIAVDSTHVYFADISQQIWSVAKGGGTPTSIAPTPASVLTADANGVYFVYNTTQNCTDKYAAFKMPSSGSTMPTHLSSGFGNCAGLVNDATWLYCADVDNGLRRIALGGGVDTVLGGNGAAAVAMDSQYVYWADTVAGGSILRLAH